MTLTFYSNRLNHHQAPVADELHRLLGEDFHFVETLKPQDTASKGSSEDFSTRPYLIRVWESDLSRKTAMDLAVSSDVAVFGASSIEYEVTRVRNTEKLTFDLSERWFKRGPLNAFSPRLLKHFWYYHTLFQNKPVYKLCASAFSAKDQRRMLSFQNRCYKWGYFPKLEVISVDDSPLSDPVKFMWCARFLKLKHPELAIKLVSRLRTKGFHVLLDMYGDGNELKISQDLALRLGLNDIIRFHGSQPNKKILDEMRNHDVFLFTSDRMEGWGAVANEALANGCVLVASDAIGSTPYLVKHRETGIVFKSGSLKSLEKEMEWLLENREAYQTIKKNGQAIVTRFWNPVNAAESLVQISRELMGNIDCTTIVEGPCSRA